MPEQRLNKVVFLISDLVGMIVAWVHMFTDNLTLKNTAVEDYLIALWITVLFGFIGGFASMAGRELWKYSWGKIKGKKDVEEN